jgi:glutathione synthase/RimK-type ligase-like ATP-grasp enzyme
MKKVLLIARAKTAETMQKADAFADRIRGLVADDDIQVENCEISELFFELEHDKLGVYHPEKKFDLREFDLVIIRHVGKFWIEAHAITLYCEHLGIQYTDTYLNRLLLDNKLSTEFLLWTQGIKAWPRTLYGPTAELIRRLPELGEKAVLKDNEGSKGRLNFVVSSPEEIQAITNKNPDKRFVLQEFIPNDGDLRVLVMNGKVPLVIRRSGDGSSHLNNTSQGGSAQLVPVDEIGSQILDACIKAAEVTKLQVAGVDIMHDLRNDDYYLLEVNNAPQVSSGSFMEEKSVAYAEMIRSMLDVRETGKGKTVIGRAEEVIFPTLGNTTLHARIDTGARSSSIWATTIQETEAGLVVRFASPDHEIYQHEQVFEHYDRVKVASSMGHEQIRYKIKLPVVIEGRRINASFTLADRSTQVYPVLIGRATLNGKFIVDVATGNPLLEEEKLRSEALQRNIQEEQV